MKCVILPHFDMGGVVSHLLMLTFTFLLSCTDLNAQSRDTCVACHTDLEGSLMTSVRDWKTSIHFENGISCSDCHGGDPRAEDMTVSMDPHKGFIGKPTSASVPKFCGKCHNAVRDNYVKSAHFQALESGMGPNCVTCHTAHRQQEVTLDLINEDSCGQCHSYEQAARLKETMRGMELSLTSLERREERLFLEGLDVERERKELFAVRNQSHRLTHVLRIAEIQAQLDTVRPALQRVEDLVRDKEKTVNDRKILGTVLMAFFLFGAAIAWWAHGKLADPASPEEPSGG